MKTKKPMLPVLQYKVPRLRLYLVKEGTSLGRATPIRTPEDAAALLEPLRHESEEHFVSLHLNTRHEVIGLHEVSHGTLSASLVHPREVFKAALLANSYAVLLCHNHPSGSKLIPSSEDIETTTQLLKAGTLLGINVVDHLILGPLEDVYSLRENFGHLWQQ